MTIAMEVIKFFVKHSEVHSSGQGVVSTTCNKLWEMSDEEFIKQFAQDLIHERKGK